ncbi:unnamed protein product, partial [Hapterophycus canaliculatus]
NGASKVVISDYATSTDQALMVPIQINIDRIQPECVPEGTLHAVGHVWRQPVGDVIQDGMSEKGRGRFDVIIMADLLFNRSQHAQLLETCDRCLRTGGPEEAAVWVSFSHHDPEKAELDMKFFALADEKGFVAKRLKTVQMRDLFVENDGLDDLRGEVHLWSLTRR